MNSLSPYDSASHDLAIQRSARDSRHQPSSVASGFSQDTEGSHFKRIFRRWPIAVGIALLFAFLGFTSCRFIKKAYESQAEVLLHTPSQSPGLGEASQLAALAGLNSLGGGQSDIPAEIEKMTSDDSLREVARRSGLNLDPVKSRALITITPNKTSEEIIQISVRAPSQKNAQSAVQAVFDVYNEQLKQADTTVTGRLILTTKSQLDDATVKLANAETAYENYSRQVGSIDPGTEAVQNVNQLYTLRKDQMDVERELQAGHSLLNDYKQQASSLDPSVVPTLTMQQSPRIEADESKLTDLQIQRTTMASEYTPQDDVMVSNQNQIDAVKADIKDELDRETTTANSALSTLDNSTKTKAMTDHTPGYVVSTLTRAVNPIRESVRQNLVAAQAQVIGDSAQIAVINHAVAQANADIAAEPNKLRKLGDLKNDAVVYQKIYDELKSDLVQLNSRRSADEITAKFLQAPTWPQKPVAPLPGLYTIAAGTLGLLLGSILLFLLDNLDPTIRDSSDIALLSDVPVLQSLPHYPAGQLTGEQKAAQTQSFRRLASILTYQGLGTKVKTLLLTSTAANDGSSSVARQLAEQLTNAGRKIILVDVTGEQPQIVSLASSSPIDRARTTANNGHGDNNLAVKSTTDLSVNVDELFNLSYTEALVQKLRENADIVIFDAPSVFEGVSTAILAEKVDAILYVSRIKNRSREEVRQALSLIFNCSAPVLGVVVNDETI